jgi:hypothetical protein
MIEAFTEVIHPYLPKEFEGRTAALNKATGALHLVDNKGKRDLAFPTQVIIEKPLVDMIRLVLKESTDAV